MNQLPTRQQILDWIADNPDATAKRDIAKAFNIKGSARIELKRLLRELEAEGVVDRRRRSYRDHERLPPVSVLEILPPDADGDLFARPMEWQGTAPMPRILFSPRKADPAVAPGERILARLTEVEGEDYAYQARLMRRIGAVAHKVVGIFRKETEGGRIVPIDKGQDRQWRVRADATLDAQDGELVEAEQVGSRNRLGLAQARIIERLGDPSAPRAVSLIAIHQHGIPDDFPDAVMAEADATFPATMSGREDLRALPLVTIDPADARDHDDAVAAMPDDDPRNPDGMVIWVAIADVAAYVRPGTALDREARHRGNSTYFPDRVVPMLPDILSGDLLSLHEGVDRPVIAVRMRLDARGNKISHDFHRGMMHSAASLSYEQAQAAAAFAATVQGKSQAGETLSPAEVAAIADQPAMKPAYVQRQEAAGDPASAQSVDDTALLVEAPGGTEGDEAARWRRRVLWVWAGAVFTALVLAVFLSTLF